MQTPSVWLNMVATTRKDVSAGSPMVEGFPSNPVCISVAKIHIYQYAKKTRSLVCITLPDNDIQDVSLFPLFDQVSIMVLAVLHDRPSFFSFAQLIHSLSVPGISSSNSFWPVAHPLPRLRRERFPPPHKSRS